MTVRLDDVHAQADALELLAAALRRGDVAAWSGGLEPTGIAHLDVVYAVGAEPDELPGVPVDDSVDDPTPTTRPARPRGRK